MGSLATGWWVWCNLLCCCWFLVCLGVLTCSIFWYPKESLDGDMPEGDVSNVVCTWPAFICSQPTCFVAIFAALLYQLVKASFSKKQCPYQTQLKLQGRRVSRKQMQHHSCILPLCGCTKVNLLWSICVAPGNVQQLSDSVPGGCASGRLGRHCKQFSSIASFTRSKTAKLRN